MIWQDWYFAFACSCYTLVMLPAVFDRRTKVPLSTSLGTSLLMLASGVAYWTLGLELAAWLSAVGAVPWLVLTMRRR